METSEAQSIGETRSKFKLRADQPQRLVDFLAWQKETPHSSFNQFRKSLDGNGDLLYKAVVGFSQMKESEYRGLESVLLGEVERGSEDQTTHTLLDLLSKGQENILLNSVEILFSKHDDSEDSRFTPKAIKDFEANARYAKTMLSSNKTNKFNNEIEELSKVIETIKERQRK